MLNIRLWSFGWKLRILRALSKFGNLENLWNDQELNLKTRLNLRLYPLSYLPLMETWTFLILVTVLSIYLMMTFRSSTFLTKNSKYHQEIMGYVRKTIKGGQQYHRSCFPLHNIYLSCFSHRELGNLSMIIISHQHFEPSKYGLAVLWHNFTTANP